MLTLNLKFAEVKINGESGITYTVFYDDNDSSFNGTLEFDSWQDMHHNYPTINDLLNEIGCIKDQVSECIEIPFLLFCEGIEGLYTQE